MRFHTEHDFSAAAVEVLAAMTDPGFSAGLELEDLAPAQVLRHEASGDHALLELRYGYVGALDPIARRVIGESQLHWVQRLDADLAAMTGRLEIRSEDAGHRLRADAAISFFDVEAGVRRVLEGTLEVAVPLLGRRAERAILGGFERRLDVEATQLERYLEG